jgi:protein CpxP
MKTWIKRTLAGLVGATALVAGLSACGGHRHHGEGGRMSDEKISEWTERGIERATKKLDLDAAQRQNLTVLAGKLREQRTALIGSTTNPRDEARALLAGPTFDRERALGLINEKTEAVRSKSPEVVAAAADFYDSLRPDQQQRLRDMMDKKRGRWGSRG